MLMRKTFELTFKKERPGTHIWDSFTDIVIVESGNIYEAERVLKSRHGSNIQITRHKEI